MENVLEITRHVVQEGRGWGGGGGGVGSDGLVGGK